MRVILELGEYRSFGDAFERSLTPEPLESKTQGREIIKIGITGECRRNISEEESSSLK